MTSRAEIAVQESAHRSNCLPVARELVSGRKNRIWKKPAACWPGIHRNWTPLASDLVHEFTIDSALGQGTQVVVVLWRQLPRTKQRM
jgi:hypothetical protein